MLRSRNNKRLRKLYFVFTLISLVIVGIIVFYLRSRETTVPSGSTVNTPIGRNNIDYGPAKSSDSIISNNIKNNDPSSKPANVNSESTATKIQITTTSVNLSGDTYHIGSIISGTTSGMCTAKFVLSADPSVIIEASSQAILQNNTYTCGPLNKDRSAFVRSGQYIVYVTLVDGDKTASSEYKPTVNIP